MTCIVGIAERGGVWIGADSAGTSDLGLQTIREEDRKVFFLNSPDQLDYTVKSPILIVGGTTSYRFLDLLQYKMKVPAYDPLVSPKKYLVTTFIDAIRECLKTSGYDRKDDGEEQCGEFLVGWQGKLYHIYEDYQVETPSVGYDTLGGTSGDIALGVLFATRHLDMGPEQRIEQALQAAAYHCRSVRPPFIIEKLVHVKEE